MTEELLNWQRIREWTESQKQGAIVGTSCTNGSCPLAQYLHDQTGRYWTVGPSIRPAEGTKQDRLHKPEWVRAMIEQVDKATGSEMGEVTREQFLEVLDRVKPE